MVNAREGGGVGTKVWERGGSNLGVGLVCFSASAFDISPSRTRQTTVA
jgi:hypothetical protein